MKNGMDFKRGQLAKEIEDPFYLKDPILLDLFEKCKPPKEAYLYFPKGEDIIVINNKKPESSYRKIYYNVPFFDMEKKYINKLREIIIYLYKYIRKKYISTFLILSIIKISF